MRSCQGEHFANIVVLNEVLGYGRQLHQLQFEPVLPVDILLHVAGHVKVDDMLHVGDVKTSRCHCCCNNDWRLTNLEPGTRLSRKKRKNLESICIECEKPAESLLPFSLRPVAVNARDRETLPEHNVCLFRLIGKPSVSSTIMSSQYHECEELTCRGTRPDYRLLSLFQQRLVS